MSIATKAGTCLDAVASALSANAGLVGVLLLLLLLLLLLVLLQLAHRRLGPTQTARFDADIMFTEELLEMCSRTQRKWRKSEMLALGSRSQSLLNN